MKKILFIGPIEGFEAAAEMVGGAATLVHVPAERQMVREAIQSSEALIDASMKISFDQEMLESATRLQIISTATTGADHIDKEVAESNGVKVRTLREDSELLFNITPAAELSWALVLACARRVVPATQHVRKGHWVREDFPGPMLNGRVLGLVGCGRIGQWMARYGQAFGMRVLGFDPLIESWPNGVEKSDLDTVLEQADVVSVHVHLGPETNGMIGTREFARMKSGAIFVNTSRGAICDERALVHALESGHLSAAGLDVLEGEPEIARHPLVEYARKHENLLITPHCGGFSPDAVRRVCARAVEKVLVELNVRES